MKKKTKWNYAVMRSIFGDLWVGKTKLSVGKDRVFADVNDAIEKAKMLFEDRHPDFDVEDEYNEDNNMDLQAQYTSIVETEENEIELIRKEMEKFIV